MKERSERLKKIEGHTQIYNSIYLQSVLIFHYSLSATDFPWIFVRLWQLKIPTPHKNEKKAHSEVNTVHMKRPRYINLIKYIINFTTTDKMPVVGTVQQSEYSKLNLKRNIVYVLQKI